MLTPIQCRLARVALNLGVRELAEKAGLSAMTVTRFENGHSVGSKATKRKLRGTLEQAGIEFIDANGGGPGVRLKGN